MRKGVSVAIWALVAMAGAQGPGRPDVVSAADRARLEPPALAWFKSNAAPFAVDVPTPEELRPLLAQLDGARVVGFGEPTHGDQQSQLFKNHAIRELVRQGRIDSLMLEINRAPGAAFDRYVNEGKGDLADLMINSTLFGIWKNDEFASLMLWLRGYVMQTGKPIRVYGVDCQDPATDIEFALNWLERHSRREAMTFKKELESLLASGRTGAKYTVWLEKQTREDYVRLHTQGTALVRAIERQQAKSSPPAGVVDALYAARAGVQGLEAFELDFGAGEPAMTPETIDYYSRRDVAMAANLLQRLGEGRAALWAHDMHTIGSLPPIPEVANFKTIGTEIRRALKERYVAVGFAWTLGSFRARLLQPGDDRGEAGARPLLAYVLACNRPGDLGEFLSRVGPERFFVDLRRVNEATREWGNLPYFRGWCGWGVDPKNWLESPDDAVPTLPLHDILVYTRTLGPSTLWLLPAKPAEGNSSANIR